MQIIYITTTLKNVSALCQIQLQWKVIEHFLNRIKKNVEWSYKNRSRRKQYFEIKNSQTRFFSALSPETDEQMKLVKNKIRVNL